MQPADIIAMQGKSPISAAVASATQGEVSHVALVVSVDPVALVLESVFHCRTVPLDIAAIAHEPVYVCRNEYLTRAQRQAIIERAYVLSIPSTNWVDQLALLSPGAREILGQELSALNTQGYSFLRDVLIGLDRLTDSYFFTSHASQSLDPVCSWLIAHAYDWVGERFNRPPDSCTPWDILQHARRADGWSVGRMR